MLLDAVARGRGLSLFFYRERKRKEGPLGLLFSLRHAGRKVLIRTRGSEKKEKKGGRRKELLLKQRGKKASAANPGRKREDSYLFEGSPTSDFVSGT